MTQRHRRFGMFLTVLMTVWASTMTNASADDTKTYPGAQCQVEGSGNYVNGTPPAWGLYGGVYSNLHANYEHVICPITRDQTKNLSGTSAVSVRIYNSGLGRGFWCELWSHDRFGGAGTVAGFPSFPVALQTHHVDAIAVGLTELVLDTSVSTAGGYYSLHCEVPPQGYIYSYQVKEFPDTNKN